MNSPFGSSILTVTAVQSKNTIGSEKLECSRKIQKELNKVYLAPQLFSRPPQFHYK